MEHKIGDSPHFSGILTACLVKALTTWIFCIGYEIDKVEKRLMYPSEENIQSVDGGRVLKKVFLGAPSCLMDHLNWTSDLAG